MAVPLLDVNAQNHPLLTDMREAFERVLQSGQFINGQEVTDFEAALSHSTGLAHSIGMSSGTDAILVALMALDIGPGDEVLVPAFTFFATAGCVSRTGATPVFVDSDPVSFNIDVADARRKVTERTKAIIPVHLFGQSADMNAVLELSLEKNLYVIEDAAQSINATYHQQKVGSFGHYTTFSFFPSKNLGGLGDGGALACKDSDLANRAFLIRNHGMYPKYHHHLVGGNFRLDALQAAFLRVKLQQLPCYFAGRRANAQFYQEQLRQLPGVVLAQEGQDICQDAGQDLRIVLPIELAQHEHTWNQFTLRVLHGQRDALKDFLQSKQIGCEIYYPITMDLQPCFANLPLSSLSGCGVAHQLANQALSIPIYAELNAEQRNEVVATIAEFLQN